MEADGSETYVRGYSDSETGLDKGVTDDCDTQDGYFGAETTRCYCQGDLCNGAAAGAASAAFVAASMAAILALGH